jgi:hypothetical protein
LLQTQSSPGHATWGVATPAKVAKGDITFRPCSSKPKFEVIIFLHPLDKCIAKEGNPVTTFELEGSRLYGTHTENLCENKDAKDKSHDLVFLF